MTTQEDVASLKATVAVLEKTVDTIQKIQETNKKYHEKELEEEREKRRELLRKHDDLKLLVIKLKQFRDVVIGAFVVLGFLINFVREPLLKLFGGGANPP